MEQNVNLDEINNIPEEEFKKHLLEWIEDIDISKELHSKLRSDLFQKFGKTTLGRKIALQYQQTQRIVLSPLVLVINTLVAEFLYAQNCHFSLSVFNSEVPFKNTLPDFERKTRFRFNSVELEEILEALGLVQPEILKLAIVRSYETPHERDGILIDSSLLFCVIKTLINTVTAADSKPQNDIIEPQQSKDIDDKCHQCRKQNQKPKYDELHSKYFKHFYKYLELLSEHVVEISQNMKKLKETTKSNDKASEKLSQSCRLNKRLDKITESLKNLSKSNRKGRKVAEIIKSVTCLTNEIERCSGNMSKYSMALYESSKETANNPTTPLNYSEWLNQMSGSVFGQRFMRNLEIAQQKAMAKEVEKVKEIYKEKLQTNRMLIKLHYKQKTLEKFRSTIQNTPANQTCRDEFNGKIDEKLRLLKEKEFYWQQCIAKDAVTKKPDDDMKPQPLIQKEVVNDPDSTLRENSTIKTSAMANNYPYDVHQVQIPVKKKKPINIELFEEPVHPIEPVIDNIVHVAKNRLQELENESQQLDKSFQSYLQKQDKQKQQLSNDIAKVWHQYEQAKDNMNKTFVVPKRHDTSSSRIHFNETAIPIAMGDLTEEFETTAINYEAIQFENPYKKLQEKLTKSMADLTIKRETTFVTKREIATQSNGNQPLVIIQHSDETASADKNNQIPSPMKIKSIMKKPIDIEPKIHLIINKSQSNDHHSSDQSDASSYLNLKNVSPLEDVHMSDWKPSETPIKPKRSDNSLKTIASDNSVVIHKEIGLRKELELGGSDVVAGGIAPQTNNESTAIQLNDRLQPKTQSNTNSTSSDSYGKLNISTGRKSSSSDDFWK